MTALSRPLTGYDGVMFWWRRIASRDEHPLVQRTWFALVSLGLALAVVVLVAGSWKEHRVKDAAVDAFLDRCSAERGSAATCSDLVEDHGYDCMLLAFQPVGWKSDDEPTVDERELYACLIQGPTAWLEERSHHSGR